MARNRRDPLRVGTNAGAARRAPPPTRRANQEVAQAKQAFQERLRTIRAALQTSLTPTAAPLVKVVDASYAQLPLQRQVVVETSADRDAALAAELRAARAEWLAAARAGCDPLPGWVGCTEWCSFSFLDSELKLPSEEEDGDADTLLGQDDVCQAWLCQAWGAC